MPHVRRCGVVGSPNGLALVPTPWGYVAFNVISNLTDMLLYAQSQTHKNLSIASESYLALKLVLDSRVLALVLVSRVQALVLRVLALHGLVLSFGFWP